MSDISVSGSEHESESQSGYESEEFSSAFVRQMRRREETDYKSDASTDICDFSDKLSEGPPETLTFIKIENQTPLASEISKLLKNVGIIHTVSGDCNGILPYTPLIKIDQFGIISLPLVECQWTELNGFLTEKISKIPGFAARGEAGMIELVSKRLSVLPEKLVLNSTCVVVRGPGSHSSRKSFASLLPKRDGFAHLIIQLPSLFEGGNFTVYDVDEKQRTEDFGKKAGTNAIGSNFVVCYHDDEYELENIDEGYIVELVYSISQTDSSSTEALKHSDVVDDLTRTFEQMDNEHFIYFCKYGYKKGAVKKSGVSCLKGIDDARFRSMVAANELLPENKRLRIYMGLSQRSLFYGCYDDDEESETLRFTCWYEQNGTLISPKDHWTDVPTAQILNPDEVPFWKLWGKTHSSVIDCDRDGESKDSVYRRHVIAAWPNANDFEFKSRYFGRVDALKKFLAANSSDKLEILTKSVILYEQDDIKGAEVLFKEILDMNHQELSILFTERYLRHMKPSSLGKFCFSPNILPQLVQLVEAYPRVTDIVVIKLSGYAPASSYRGGIELCRNLLNRNKASDAPVQFLQSSINSINRMESYDMNHQTIARDIKQLPELCLRIKRDSVYETLQTV
ncbi:hypothetical protein HK098_002057 [Nowakowskiella sp. JEL0407]|nr:hypothetical protein HK098_002057 [Nowakowskiella sp. JEL0407]